MSEWVEDENTETRTKAGGGEKRVTPYAYRKEWKSDPVRSSSFHEPRGHGNPSTKYQSLVFPVTCFCRPERAGERGRGTAIP